MYTKYLLASAASLLVLSAGFGLQAQEPRLGWNQPLETRPVLAVRAPGGMTGTIELQQNEYVGIVMKPAFRGAESLCVSAVQIGFDPVDLHDAAAAWHVEARLVELRPGAATIDLRWTRGVNRSDLVPADSFSSEQRVAVREGDSRILDLVRTTRRPTPECDSFGLTYEVQFEGPPSLARAAIAYDLWLVQQDSDGELVTDRYQVTAKQGQEVDYFFRPVAYTADGRRASDAAAILMNVSGTIRGRVRTDGDIDLTVDGSRWFTDAAASVGTGSRGRTMLTVKPGETIEVKTDLPAAGTLGKFGDLNQVFGKHRTAVRVTARRLW